MQKKRLKTPTIIQMEAAECGAAALSIILSYYGRFIPLEELRYQCGVSRDGCNAYNLVKAAEEHGLEAEGYELTPKNLEELPLPCICHWKGNHFVVLEGISPSIIYINDPATGPVKISFNEFCQNFSGVAITFKPTDRFHKKGKAVSFYALAKERLKKVAKPIILFLLVMQLLAMGIGMLPPAATRFFLDEILQKKMLSWTVLFLFCFAALVFMQTCLTYLQSGVFLRLSLYLNDRLSNNFIKHLLKLPILFFTQRFGAEIINRINLNNSVSNSIVNNVTVVGINIALVFIYATVMFMYSPLIAFIGILALCINLSMYFWIARRRIDNYSRLQQEQAKSYGISMDALQNMEAIKISGTEHFGLARVIGHKINMINSLQNIGIKDIGLTTAAAFVNQVAGIGVLGLGCLLVMEGNLSIGMLAALQMLLTGFLAPVTQLIGFSMGMQSLKIDMIRIDDVLKSPVDPLYLIPSNPAAELTDFSGKVELQSVSFGYNPLDIPVIKNFSMTIEAAKRTALVGGSGSGKTTIAKLICGLFHPWEGRILYQDQPLDTLSQDQRRGLIGWVDQDIFVFSGTIRDNLTLWAPQFTESDLIRAATDACLHQEIMQRKGGYDAELIEGGQNLSQGQRQRLEIARALLHNPKLLVLDEATSAIDSETEQKIIQNISKRGCACLFIAHRLSTIKTCETIVVLEKGEIADQGTHDDLKIRSPFYKVLVNKT
jgi:ATP-binding cassette subfamily C protein